MKLNTIIILIISAIALAAISRWVGQISYTWLPPQASQESILIDNLFSFLVAIGTFIFLGVSGTLTYSILFQRAGRYDFSDGPHIEGNITLEIIWTVIPFLLVIWIAIYSYQIYDQISILGPMEHLHHQTTPQAKTSLPTIEVIARQWSWEFHYPQSNITTTELHLPNNQRIRLILKSEDVLHGFYIPAFRVKQDIIPHRAINFEFTPILEGRYRIRDSQYSGTYFAAMQTDVVVESPEAYQEWLTNTAKQDKTTAYNQAFEEYQETSIKNKTTGWKTIIPAPPPMVNYPNTLITHD